MRINRQNFESYLIDYMDGNLSSPEQEEMRIFLLLNNDPEEFPEDLSEFRLPPPSISYPHKNRLKKDVVQLCPDFEVIAIAENIFPEEKALNIKQNIQKQELITIYKKLKLKPDNHIIYKKKQKLYQPARRLTLPYKMAAAAIFLLLAGMTWLSLQLRPNADIQIGYSMIIPEQEQIPVQNFPASIQQDKEPVYQTHQKKTARNQIIRNTQTKNSVPVLTESFHTLSLVLQKEIVNYQLITDKKTDKINIQPEIYLAESALNWKSSENKILADNIFSNMIYAGRIIAEKIRNLESASNK